MDNLYYNINNCLKNNNYFSENQNEITELNETIILTVIEEYFVTRALNNELDININYNNIDINKLNPNLFILTNMGIASNQKNGTYKIKVKAETIKINDTDKLEYNFMGKIDCENNKTTIKTKKANIEKITD